MQYRSFCNQGDPEVQVYVTLLILVLTVLYVNVFVSDFLFLWNNSVTIGEMVFRNGFTCENYFYTIQGEKM